MLSLCEELFTLSVTVFENGFHLEDSSKFISGTDRLVNFSWKPEIFSGLVPGASRVKGGSICDRLWLLTLSCIVMRMPYGCGMRMLHLCML